MFSSGIETKSAFRGCVRARRIDEAEDDLRLDQVHSRANPSTLMARRALCSCLYFHAALVFLFASHSKPAPTSGDGPTAAARLYFRGFYHRLCNRRNGVAPRGLLVHPRRQRRCGGRLHGASNTPGVGVLVGGWSVVLFYVMSSTVTADPKCCAETTMLALKCDLHAMPGAGRAAEDRRHQQTRRAEQTGLRHPHPGQSHGEGRG